MNFFVFVTDYDWFQFHSRGLEMNVSHGSV